MEEKEREEMDRRVRKMTKKVITYVIIVIISVLALVFLRIWGCMSGYSKGERAGVVTKFAEKGIIIKSYEGELLMALPSETGITTPEKFKFSLRPSNKATALKVKEALGSGLRVRLSYSEWLIRPIMIDTHYEVVDVISPK